MRTIEEYRQILAKKGWRICLMEFWHYVWRLRYCRDLSIVKANEEYRVYRYLKRKYTKTLLKSKVTPQTTPNPYSNKIWVLWLQGLENAPQLVKACIESQKKNCGDLEVVVLTNENLNQYITLPDYILKKHQQKIISFTHLSDIIRISLLAEYGGVWLDATCLLTDVLPDCIRHPESCFFFRSPFSNKRATKISNWLIAAQPNDPIIVDVRNLLLSFWEKENFVRNYFIFHLFFTLTISKKASNNEQWNAVPYLNNANPHMLQEQLFCSYNEKWFNDVCCKMSAVHKLTYKFSAEQATQDGTYYQKIINLCPNQNKR